MSATEPGPVHAGLCDGDDIEAAAAALMEEAQRAEPTLTPVMFAVAAATGGAGRRLDTRLKTRESVLDKLDRFRRRSSPRYQLARFNDALRYTIVYPDLIYWRAAEATLALLRDDQGVAVGRGWSARGYRGVNLTLRSPSGFDYELQLHTPASLAAAEATHGLYEEQRRLPRGTERWRQLDERQRRIWGEVPVPPGKVDLS